MNRLQSLLGIIVVLAVMPCCTFAEAKVDEWNSSQPHPTVEAGKDAGDLRLEIAYGDEVQVVSDAYKSVTFVRRGEEAVRVLCGGEEIALKDDLIAPVQSDATAATAPLSQTPSPSPAAPQGLSWLREKDGSWVISCARTDDAGNEKTVRARVRIIEPLRITGSSLGDADLPEGRWINAQALEDGPRLIVRGSAEGAAKLQYRFLLSHRIAPKWTPLDAGMDGEWQAALDLAENRPADGKLAFEIRYTEGPGQENWQEKCGDAPTVDWQVDATAPRAPVLAVNGGAAPAEGGPIVVETGSEVVLDIQMGNDAARPGEWTMAFDGGAAEPIETAPLQTRYPFPADRSGKYEFSITVLDAAGNISEPATVSLLAVSKIALNREGGDKAFLNEGDVEEGLTLDIIADEGRDDVVCTCLVDGVSMALGSVANSKWQVGCNDLKALGRNEPVLLEVRASYADLDNEALTGAWKARIDPWPPAVAILSAVFCGSANENQYFADEAIFLRVQSDVDAVEVNGNGIPLNAIDATVFNDSLATDNRREVPHAPEGEGGITYYRLDAADADTLMLVATATDPAGNQSDDNLQLDCIPPKERYDRIRITAPEDSDVITTQSRDGGEAGDDAGFARVSGRARDQYRLVAFDRFGNELPIQSVPVSNDGHWEMRLGYDDLPDELKSYEGEWPVTLKYPSEKYTWGESEAVASVSVDTCCALAWADEPEELDTTVRLITDPLATVTLIREDGGQDVSLVETADREGVVVFQLEAPITMKTRLSAAAIDPHGNRQSIEERNIVSTAVHALLTNVKAVQTGNETVRLTGTGEPGLWIAIAVEGGGQENERIDENGSFSKDISVDGEADYVMGNIWYRDATEDNSAQIWRVVMDNTPPELSVEADGLTDMGGTVTIKTEKGAVVSFEGVDVDDSVAKAEVFEVVLPEMPGVEKIAARAADAFGNSSAPVEIPVLPARTFKAGFDAPEEGAKTDCEGSTRLTGWVASAGDAPPEGLKLIIAQEDRRVTMKLAPKGAASADALLLQPADDRLKADLQDQVGDMRARHCWTFTCDLAMRDWKKNGLITAALSVDKEKKETLATRSFTGILNVTRRNIYIALTALALVLSLICLAIVANLNRRIRRVEEGKLDYSNATVRTIDRHR